MDEPELLTSGFGTPLDRVATARRQLDTARLAFDAAVSEARVAGASLREVGAASGLSHTGVSKLCARLRRQAPHLRIELVDGRWRKIRRAAPPAWQVPDS